MTSLKDPIDAAFIDEQTGRSVAPLGPGDNSDSGSDLGPNPSATDTDSSGTGERASVDPMERQDLEDGADIEPDRTVGEAEAGLAHTRPDPTRNGG